MKKILITTDFSHNSNNATMYGLELAQKLKAEVLIYHGYEVPVYADDPTLNMGLEFEYEVKNKEGIREYVEDIKKAKGKELKIEGLSKQGFSPNDIEQIVKEHEINLVVMGAQGKSNLLDSLLGSNSFRMISHLNCPVLVIPKTMVFHDIKKIIYPTEFQFNDFISLESLIVLFEPFKPEIIITNICTDKKKIKENQERMDWLMDIASQRLKYEKITYKVIVENPLKLTPVFRSKLTPLFRSKVPPVFRGKLTPPFWV